MTFVPLDTDSKLKGKAVIDGIGSRLGKSGGSVVHQGLLIIFSTITAGAPYAAGVLLVVIGLWMYATRSLGKKFNAISNNKHTISALEIDIKKPAPAYKPSELITGEPQAAS